MGIKWFETFLNTYQPAILREVQLRDQYLVIDGNSLMHRLYTDFDLSCR